MSSKVSSTKAPTTTAHNGTESVKGAVQTGIGAIETTALAAAEIPLSILKSLGVSDEAMETAREGHRQLVHGIRSALGTVAEGVTDTTAEIASGITKGFTTAATTAGEAASRLTSTSTTS